MPRDLISPVQIHDHVQRLADQHPPIPLASVDRTIHRPEQLRGRFSNVLKYLARVELEVDRNVLELLVLLPHVEETDRFFYEDVWQPQEIQHGLILDRLQQDAGLPAAEPMLEIQTSMKILGALAHLPAIGEVSRLLYYLTGAATERQAVLAYNTLGRELTELGERAINETIIKPIKRQEPGHFAFYQMSATSMIQHGVLKPWQLFLARELRSKNYMLVGVNERRDYLGDMGGVMTELGMDTDMESFAREIGRLEARLLWAHRKGLEFPEYVLAALRDSVEMYREREHAA